MKKHENAIKMLMKNAIDTKTLYGWYEDDNGAKLMTNGHLIIKLSGATLDYVGDFQKMNDKNNDKCFVDRMNDIIEVAKKGEYKTTVNIQDIKMFDRYNTDKKPFCIRYSDNSYIGFNPYYFNKLNILTGSNLLTITDNKCPMYFAGDDIECILLPVMLEKSYNADNYAVFLEELKGCYIQEENEKAKKAAEKKNTSVLSLEEEVTYNGFTMWIGGKQYFLMSNKKRVTDEITKDFLKLIAANTTINIDKISESDFKYIKNAINSATITKTKSYSYGYEIIRIQQKNNGENFYSDEYNKLLIYNADFVKICLDELDNIDMSSVKTSTDTTQDTTQDTRQTETPAHKSNNCLFVTVAKDIKLDKIAQLQNVANLPTLASIPTYSAYFAHKINNIVSTKRNTNNGRKAHGRTNGATCAECAGVLEVVNTS